MGIANIYGLIHCPVKKSFRNFTSFMIVHKNFIFSHNLSKWVLENEA